MSVTQHGETRAATPVRMRSPWRGTIADGPGSVILMPLSGGLSDRVGRRTMLAVALLGYMVLAPATMYLVGQANFGLAIIAVVIPILPFVMMQSVGYPITPGFYVTLVPAIGLATLATVRETARKPLAT